MNSASQAISKISTERDTLRNRLDQTSNILSACEGLLFGIAEKMAGPVPQNVDKQPPPPPPGVHALSQEVHACAMRIRDGLEALSNDLA